MPRYRISMDIGGTFTDLVFQDVERGHAFTNKVLSTPENQAQGVLAGLGRHVEDFGDVEFLVHGTTVGLNAFLERRGDRTLLVTTEGFRDVLHVARGNRLRLYHLHFRKPAPLVPLTDIYTVRERLAADGSVREPLVEEDVEAIARRVLDEGIGTVAVCLLHAFRNPSHELRVREILLARVPSLSVSLSHEIAPEWREYERSSTTVLNAYIAPKVERYLSSLQGELASRRFQGALHVMQSNGGVTTAPAARRQPVQTLMSGPVGGAIGGAALARHLDRPNLMCVDMGGTSFDASLVIDGEPSVSTETRMEGLPILLSLVDIHTVGAGGGSVAWIEAGALRVGPHSAGSVPGPACYGRGGTAPTVTDANAYLGRMNPAYFLDGDMGLDLDAAGRALDTVAEPLGLTTVEAAEGILAIVNAKMADAMRTITVEQGVDPRVFNLVAFGGAGPMHAAALAEELEIDEVVVPWAPGTFSAWGMLNTDTRRDLRRNFFQALAETEPAQLAEAFAELERDGRAILEEEEIPAERRRFDRQVDMRYTGQEYSLTIDVPADLDLGELARRFHEAYAVRYGHSTPGAPVELVNVRVTAVGRIDERAAASEVLRRGEDVAPTTRPVVFAGVEHEARIIHRDTLSAESLVEGPAVIEEPTSTTVVPPGWTVRQERLNAMIMKRSRA